MSFSTRFDLYRSLASLLLGIEISSNAADERTKTVGLDNGKDGKPLPIIEIYKPIYTTLETLVSSDLKSQIENLRENTTSERFPPQGPAFTRGCYPAAFGSATSSAGLSDTPASANVAMPV